MNISRYKESLQKKGWYFCLQEAWKRICPLWWVRDVDVVDQVFERRAYRYLKRKYLPLLKHFNDDEKELSTISTQGVNRTIWVCWLQGEDNAPAIVKKCISSIRRHSAGYEVVIVTNENLGSLVEIPPYITKKLKKKRMQFAQYSDYIRLALLAKYGGIWIDATVFLSSPIPPRLSSQLLFCFKSPSGSKSVIAASSWFIVACQGNRIIRQVKYLFERYWAKEGYLCNYYLFHLLFALVVNYDEENRTMWHDVPYVHNIDVHTLQFELFEPYDAQRFEEICSRAFAHKLTYKFKDKALLEKPGTYYRFVLNS